MGNYFKKLLPMNKKGMGIGDIYPVILTIVLVAILIAISMFILDEFGDQWKDREFETITNETLDIFVDGSTNITVDGVVDCKTNTFAVTLVTNATGGVVIESGNYTFYNDGNIINLTEQADSFSQWNISYTYYHGGSPCEATTAIIDDFADFIPWIGIILLVVAAAIVLGILVRSFGGAGRV